MFKSAIGLQYLEMYDTAEFAKVESLKTSRILENLKSAVIQGEQIREKC